MRPRKPQNRKYDIRNFYVSPRGYCSYTNPVTKERIALGGDIRSAMEAAISANERLMLAPELLGRIMGTETKHELVGDHLDFMLTYWKRRVTSKNMSEETYNGYRRQVENFRKEHGKLFMNKGDVVPNMITKKHFSTYLDALKPTMRKNTRAMLNTVWTHAVGRDWADVNLAAGTLSYAKDIEVQRERLTLDAYQKIRECAPPHDQALFDFALQILQRRKDLAAMLKDQITTEKNSAGKMGVFINLTQIKSGAPLKIELGPEVIDVINRLKDNVVSRHILHWPYTDGRNRKLAGKRYTADNISGKFEVARKLAIEKYGLFKEWGPAQYPSFHEIRGLGAKLYEEAGYSPEMIQCLLGHDSPEMTQLYLSRHKIDVMESKAGLQLTFA